MAHSRKQDGHLGFPRLRELLLEVYYFSAKARSLFDLTRSEQVWTWSGKD